MNKIITTLLLISVLAPMVFGQDKSTEPAAALSGITELMMKTRQGGNKPSIADIAVRLEAGKEMAQKARKFLVEYPNSKEKADAHALLGIGLMEASIAGDEEAAKELKSFSQKSLKDEKIPDMMKLHSYSVNYLAEWARKNNRKFINQEEPEVQKLFLEAYFAAVDFVESKEEIFKMILLQAKSGRAMTEEEKKSLAQKVIDHPAASESIKKLGQEVLSGSRSYAVGLPLDIKFTSVDGRSIDLQKMKGRVVLIDFWATWCGPCVAEVPELVKKYNAYKDQGFEILGISLDDDKEALVSFTNKHGMTWPQYFDGKHWNNEISFRYGINSVPTVWLVDKKGNLRSTNARFGLEQQLKNLLKEAP